MRLAIDASRSGRGALTGTERYSVEIIRALAALPDRPELALYTRPGPSDVPVGSRIELVPIDRTRLWTHLGLSLAMYRDRPDALFVPAHVIPAVHPKVSVVTIHDLGYLHQPEAHPVAQRLMLDATTRWNAHNATRIIAISRQTKADLIEQYGVEAECIDVVHHGIDHTHFRPIDDRLVAERLRELGVAAPYVLFVSTIQPRKNLVRLVEAFESLGETDLTLVIAGKPGWNIAPIMRRIGLSRAAGRIMLLGYVDDDDLPVLYNGAAAYVHPALYEGFGMGIVEAMACACPVVTSDRSSMPEIAGGAAILVDPTSVESIRSGIAAAFESNRRKQLIAAGLKRSATFTWTAAAQKTLASIIAAARKRDA